MTDITCYETIGISRSSFTVDFVGCICRQDIVLFPLFYIYYILLLVAVVILSNLKHMHDLLMKGMKRSL